MSPAIDLADGDYSLRMSQTRNFYAASAQEKKFIQVMIGIDNEDLNAIEWTELNFERVPPGDSWDLVESEWLALNLKDQKIRIGFRYESNEATGEFPNWAIYTMGIREE